jgi:hypothetical protein
MPHSPPEPAVTNSFTSRHPLSGAALVNGRRWRATMRGLSRRYAIGQYGMGGLRQRPAGWLPMTGVRFPAIVAASLGPRGPSRRPPARSAADHLRDQRHGALELPAVQDHDAPRTLPERRGSGPVDSAGPSGHHQSVATRNPRTEGGDEPVCDSLRRPIHPRERLEGRSPKGYAQRLTHRKPDRPMGSVALDPPLNPNPTGAPRPW